MGLLGSFPGYRHLSRCLELRAGPSSFSQFLKCEKQDGRKESRRDLGTSGLVPAPMVLPSTPKDWEVQSLQAGLVPAPLWAVFHFRTSGHGSSLSLTSISPALIYTYFQILLEEKKITSSL